MLGFIRLFALICLLLAAPWVSAQAPEKTPKVVVEALHAELLQVMKNADALGYSGRYRQLEPVIENSFDLPALARSSVRGYWDQFTPAQQEQFISDFRRMSIDTYAQRFDGYNGEIFKTLEDNPIARGNHLVKTRLIKTDGETVSLDYILTSIDGDWRIVNVVAQGVSDLALKRSQYVGVLKRQGVAGFLARFEARLDSLPALKGTE